MQYKRQKACKITQHVKEFRAIVIPVIMADCMGLRLEILSLGLTKRSCLNQPAQLQRLVKLLKVCMKQA